MSWIITVAVVIGVVVLVAWPLARTSLRRRRPADQPTTTTGPPPPPPPGSEVHEQRPPSRPGG